MSKPNELIQQLRNVTSIVARDVNKAKIIAIKELDAEYHNRIFTKGKSTAGMKIGKYGTNPMYAPVSGGRAGSQVASSKLKPKGKNGKAKFKNGRVRKSMYMAGGYKEYRETVGRQTETVDLNLTGNLSTQITTGRTKQGVVLGFVDDDSSNLADKLEAKYGKDIFSVSDREEEAVLQTIKEVIQESVFKAFGL